MTKRPILLFVAGLLVCSNVALNAVGLRTAVADDGSFSGRTTITPLPASSVSTDRATRIDITGNWREREQSALPPHVQTSEPPLKTGSRKAFVQDLIGIEGDYTVEYEYLPALDVDPGRPGDAIECRFDKFEGIAVNGKLVSPLGWTKKSDNPLLYVLSFGMKAPADGKVRLEFAWNYTRPPRTKILVPRPKTEGSIYQAISPADGGGELLVAHGIPFLSPRIAYNRHEWIERWNARMNHAGKAKTDMAGLILRWDGGSALDAAGVEAGTLHFLGMIHLLDWANGSWYTPKGDHSYSHFVGDKAGDITLTWTDGRTTEIPLIFGFNLWYSQPWDMCWHSNPWGGRAANHDSALLGGKPENLKTIFDALALVDGIRPRGSHSSNARFIFSVDCGGRGLKSVSMRNVPELKFGPLISAMTVETKHPSAKLRTLPMIAADSANPKVVSLDSIAKQYQPSVQTIMRLYYTFLDDLPKPAVAEMPSGYFGPRYDFRGTQNAVYAANYLYVNGPANASFIADRGMGCRSPVFPGSLVGCYQDCSGVWVSEEPFFKSLPNWFKVYRETSPGKLPGSGEAWSRGLGENLREAVALGYDKFADGYVQWMDDCLMKDAKPPHWIRCLGAPDFARTVRKVGDVIEEGVRENDGHGICLWGRYMAWHSGGRSREWNAKHWPATEAAVNWIQWQLDTDTIFPGRRKDVLYTESEWRTAITTCIPRTTACTALSCRSAWHNNWASRSRRRNGRRSTNASGRAFSTISSSRATLARSGTRIRTAIGRIMPTSWHISNWRRTATRTRLFRITPRGTKSTGNTSRSAETPIAT